jgi:hypothetical protein
MEREIEVSKIVVKMGEKEIELSPAEAKKLQELLNEIFSKNKEPIYVPIYPPVDPYPCPYPYPYFPVTYTTGPTDDTTTIIYSI